MESEGRDPIRRTFGESSTLSKEQIREYMPTDEGADISHNMFLHQMNQDEAADDDPWAPSQES